MKIKEEKKKKEKKIRKKGRKNGGQRGESRDVRVWGVGVQKEFRIFYLKIVKEGRRKRREERNFLETEKNGLKHFHFGKKKKFCRTGG